MLPVVYAILVRLLLESPRLLYDTMTLLHPRTLPHCKGDWHKRNPTQAQCGCARTPHTGQWPAPAAAA